MTLFTLQVTSWHGYEYYCYYILAVHRELVLLEPSSFNPELQGWMQETYCSFATHKAAANARPPAEKILE